LEHPTTRRPEIYCNDVPLVTHVYRLALPVRTDTTRGSSALQRCVGQHRTVSKSRLRQGACWGGAGAEET
ncbi:MAG: hypothetical protein M1296_04070, partial [Chloroflexi bacterium]|nr:hypothetical protein [Chloroflexota bacterium]